MDFPPKSDRERSLLRPAWKAEERFVGYRRGLCNFCGTGCGHFLRVERGAVRGVFADPGHPVGRGRLCVRGWHIHELLTTEDRLIEPLVRRAGALVPVPLDEALDLAAGRLAAYPGREIAFLASPRASNEDTYLFAKLARAVFRTNNVGLASDSGHRESVEVLREGLGFPAAPGSLADIRRAGFLFVVGTDITRQNPIIGSELHFAARSGAKLVTLCGRTSQIARLSRRHLRHRPGTKRLVLAALAKVLFEENLYDKEFLERRADGFDAFRRSLDGLDVGAAAGTAGLDEMEIRATARELAASPRAMAFFPSGVSGLERDTIATLFNLFLAAGRIGREGSSVNPVTGISNIVGAYDAGASPGLLPGYRTLDAASAAEVGALWGAGLDPAPGRTPDELLGDPSSPLKALVVADHDEEIIRDPERLRNLEFVVYLGAYGNRFTDFAHVVLPVATYAEAAGTYTNTERRIQLNGRQVEPRGGVPPAWRVATELARRRGFDWPYASAADVMTEIGRVVPEYAAAAHERLAGVPGLQWPCDASRPDGSPSPAAEPGRRLHFVPPRTGIEPVRPTPEFPFLLMAGKANRFWHRNNIMKKTHIPRREYNALLLLYPRGFVEIHPDDARSLGVRDRGAVRVVSASGSMRVAAKVSEDVGPGTAYVPYFIRETVEEFLHPHAGALDLGQDATVPVRIEKA